MNPENCRMHSKHGEPIVRAIGWCYEHKTVCFLNGISQEQENPNADNGPDLATIKRKLRKAAKDADYIPGIELKAVHVQALGFLGLIELGQIILKKMDKSIVFDKLIAERSIEI